MLNVLKILSIPIKLINQSIRHQSVCGSRGGRGGGGSGKKIRVAIVGASGGIGQPLCLLTKLNPMVDELNLYCLVNPAGVALDISHIESDSFVKYYFGKEHMPCALENCDMILIPAGQPRKKGMSRADLFDKNAAVMTDVFPVIADVAPKAIVGIITNPVNSVVPVACEVMIHHNKFDPDRIFGVSTLDTVRANTYLARMKGLRPSQMNVPVVCGHSGKTIVPLFSQATPKVSLTQQEVECLTDVVQNAGTEVVKAKAKGHGGSATLAMAYAGSRFATTMLRAMKGEQNVTDTFFVRDDCYDTKYCAQHLKLGPNGVAERMGFGDVSQHEQKLIDIAMDQLKKETEKGAKWAQGQLKSGGGKC